MPSRFLPAARRLWGPALTLALVLALAACGSSSSSSSATSSSSAAASTSTASTSSTAATSSSSGPAMGFEGVPLEQGPSLGSAGTTQTGTVHGIQCGPTEQLAYHIHAHLAVFKDGRAYALPGGIGIPGSQIQQTQEGPEAAGGQCIYWLHTHTSDGIIHIESPTQRIYSLGDFFDEWHQPLSADQVADAHGKIVALVNGKLWKKPLRAIPLLPHEDIQLNLGEPAPPLQTVNWGATGL
jgi:hypothetical protein